MLSCFYPGQRIDSLLSEQHSSNYFRVQTTLFHLLVTLCFFTRETKLSSVMLQCGQICCAIHETNMLKATKPTTNVSFTMASSLANDILCIENSTHDFACRIVSHPSSITIYYSVSSQWPVCLFWDTADISDDCSLITVRLSDDLSTHDSMLCSSIVSLCTIALNIHQCEFVAILSNDRVSSIRCVSRVLQ
jgi:hypothetical protein